MKVIISPSYISDIKSIDEKIKDLSQEKAEMLDKISSENGRDPELVICAESDKGGWDRITVIDNSESIKDGFWKTIRVERFSTKIETLKNKPKELN